MKIDGHSISSRKPATVTTSAVNMDKLIFYQTYSPIPL